MPQSFVSIIASLFVISSDVSRRSLFDDRCDLIEEELLQMHNAQFRQFIAPLDPHFSKTLQEWQPDMDTFDVKKINAVIGSSRGFIREFIIGNVDCGNFDLSSAPSTVRTLCVMKCRQWYTIKTRLLPRCLEMLDYSRNRIYGVFDMSTLPTHTISVNLSHNNISGPFSLIGLPETIQNIQMQMNHGNTRIGTLWYAKLPALLVNVDLTNTQVGCICPIDSEYSVKKKDIFQCNQNTQIL